MPKPENVTCPDCGGPMQSRVNRTSGQRFWGCVAYPNCKGTRDTDGLSKQERASEAHGNDASDEGLPSERQRSNDRRRWPW